MNGPDDIVKGLGYTADTAWGWHHFKQTVEAFIVRYDLRQVLEVGGGRSPLFSADDVRRLGLTYTVNDLDQRELDLGPAYTAKRCFDIAGRHIPGEMAYDLIFSQMVLEHVADARLAYRNIFALLRSGGLSLSFYPTLYSPPFVLNRLLPERLSSSLVGLCCPGRNADRIPKLPACYSWCYGSSGRMAAMLQSLGYREAAVLPFYGHDYFRNIPVLSLLDNWLSLTAQRHDWRFLSSYAYCIARK